MEIIFIEKFLEFCVLFVGWSHLYDYAVAVFDDDDDDNGLSVVIIVAIVSMR
jgi:hypothetical protein